MATELLSVLGNPKAMPVIHRVDHDLESAFYSLAHEVSVMVRDGVVAVCKNTHETSETLYKAFGWDHTEPDALIALRDLMLTVTNRRSPLVRLRNSIHQDALSAVLCEHNYTATMSEDQLTDASQRSFSVMSTESRKRLHWDEFDALLFAHRYGRFIASTSYSDATRNSHAHSQLLSTAEIQSPPAQSFPANKWCRNVT